jgi:hypothetical protein
MSAIGLGVATLDAIIDRAERGDRMPAKKRELLDTGTDKRYIRRDAQGRFTKDQVDVGRSLADDRRQVAKTVSKPGQGDRGDRARKS